MRRIVLGVIRHNRNCDNSLGKALRKIVANELVPPPLTPPTFNPSPHNPLAVIRSTLKPFCDFPHGGFIKKK